MNRSLRIFRATGSASVFEFKKFHWPSQWHEIEILLARLIPIILAVALRTVGQVSQQLSASGAFMT